MCYPHSPLEQYIWFNWGTYTDRLLSSYSIGYIRFHSWFCIFYNFRQTSNVSTTVVSYKVFSLTEKFAVLHWVIPPSSLSSVQFSHSVMSNSLQPHGLQHVLLPNPWQPLIFFTVSIVLLFLECHIVRIIQHGAFWDWLLLLRSMWLSFFMSFHYLIAHFFLMLLF